MGVKDLWTVLSPICEKKSLWELEGSSIAIDLSAWICDSQSITCPQVNMYLRNLFFRTSYLLLLGVKPVFVLEGKAPELKADVIRKRLEARAPKNKPIKEKDVTRACARTRLKGLQKQCVELLSYLGIECVTAAGEAEALCAHLNAKGIVDGVITQDSDVFLYGANEVYRNFQLSPHYTCDAYRSSIIEEKLGLSRNKLIGFSILAGSDYNDGVNKVGRTSILKFLNSIEDHKVFQKFLEWRNGSRYDEAFSNQFITSDMRLELSIKMKALKDDNFPPVNVIAEYTSEPQVPEFSYNWSKPNLPGFVSFAVRKLAWEEDYAAKKVLPLLGRWQVLNPGNPSDFFIVAILRNGQGQNSSKYKVAWSQHDVETLEEKHLIANSYPHLASAFEESRNKKRKPKATAKRNRKEDHKMLEAASQPDDANLDVRDTDHQPLPKKKVTRKRTVKKTVESAMANDFGMIMSFQPPLDQYLMDQYDNPCENFSTQIEPMYTKRPKFNDAVLTDLSSSVVSNCDETVLDLSSVIDSIVSCPQSNPALNFY